MQVTLDKTPKRYNVVNSVFYGIPVEYDRFLSRLILLLEQNCNTSQLHKNLKLQTTLQGEHKAFP